MNVSRTKIVSILMVVIAVLHTAVDALDGGGFDYAAHINDLILALNGAGFYFLRDAIGDKIQVK